MFCLLICSNRPLSHSRFLVHDFSWVSFSNILSLQYFMSFTFFALCKHDSHPKVTFHYLAVVRFHPTTRGQGSLLCVPRDKWTSYNISLLEREPHITWESPHESLNQCGGKQTNCWLLTKVSWRIFPFVPLYVQVIRDS